MKRLFITYYHDLNSDKDTVYERKILHEHNKNYPKYDDLNNSIYLEIFGETRERNLIIEFDESYEQSEDNSSYFIYDEDKNLRGYARLKRYNKSLICPKNWNKCDLSEIHEFKNWDGFVCNNGYFYPTRPSFVSYYEGSYNRHEDFAIDILRENNISFNQCTSAKEGLIYGLGWISITSGCGMQVYSHDFDKNFSENQQKMLFFLVAQNNWEKNMEYEQIVSENNI